MKKTVKNTVITLAAALLVLTVSCKDILDKAPDGDLTMEEILQNPDQVEALLSALYMHVGDDGTNYGINGKGFHHWWWESFEACSDNAYTSDEANSGGGAPTMTNGYYRNANTAASHSLDGGLNWQHYWTLVRLCSQFLEVIDLPSTAVNNNENTRGRMKGEALVLRAFYYMELFKWYGALPIINSTMPFDTDFSETRRGTAQDVARQIEADCNAALQIDDLPWRIETETNAGRMTKAVALALKSEAWLYAASPLHNGGSDSYWETAYQASKQAVNDLKAHGYQLYTDCKEPQIYAADYMGEPAKKAAAFRELMCKSAKYSAAPDDRETIYQVGGDPYQWAGATWHIGFLGSNMPNTYKCGPGPTQEFVDAFEIVDPATGAAYPLLNLATPYSDEKHLHPNYNSELPANLYDPTNPYVNRDPRFYQSVIYNGSHVLWQGEGDQNKEIIDWEIQTYVGGRNEITFTTTEYAFTRTGYYACKLIRPGVCALNSAYIQGTGVDNSRWKYYRLAETLLNLAEAANEAGHTADAIAAVNEVRARVGMPAIPALGKDQLRLRIHNERRIELSWEESRYFDLRRWTPPTGDLRSTCQWFTAMWITKNDDGSFNYERRVINENGGRVGGWDNRDLLLPIPQSEASLLESITGEKWQNPGW
jgi:hypothetical protein